MGDEAPQFVAFSGVGQRLGVGGHVVFTGTPMRIPSIDDEECIIIDGDVAGPGNKLDGGEVADSQQTGTRAKAHEEEHNKAEETDDPTIDLDSYLNMATRDLPSPPAPEAEPKPKRIRGSVAKVIRKRPAKKS